MIKKIPIYIALIFLSVSAATAQKISTKSGIVTFQSNAVLKEISGLNEFLSCSIDLSSGEVHAEIPMDKFTFKEEMMQIVFQTDYLHTDKYPKAILNGRIENLHNIKFSEMGMYNAQLKGNIEIHGKRHPFRCTGKINVTSKETMQVKANFPLILKMFDVIIPEHSAQDIAPKVEVSVDLLFYNENISIAK
ncbi:MAG: hypothetical protein CSB06_01010 [Bacteroidia bacterium]|nr:MAG: hypothetical protein CSB06_01010 [Bacteroidia bacterium]